MTTIKSYTSLEQSKKLAEFLPLESADMIWVLANPDLPMIKAIAYKDSEKSKYYEILPAWSLAALLDVLPEPNLLENNGWHLFCDNKDHFSSSNGYNNPVDACVAMIIKLYELKKL